MTDRASETHAGTSPNKRLKDTDTPAYRERKADLMSQLTVATEKYLQASGAKNPDAKQQALQHMRDSSKRFYALVDEVKQKNGGTLPTWWNE
jgi:hypothetical protein